MRAKVWLGVATCPAVEQLRQPGCLHAARREVAFQDEHQDHVAFGNEIGDVLGHHCPGLGAGSGGDEGIFNGLQPDLADMDGIMAVGVA